MLCATRGVRGGTIVPFMPFSPLYTLYSLPLGSAAFVAKRRKNLRKLNH